MRSSASGVRSSWLACATKERSRSSVDSTRASKALSVLPRRVSSSSPSGTGSRRLGSAAVSSAARRRISSTGRRAAPATAYAPTNVSSTSSGIPTRSCLRTRRRFSSPFSRVSPTTSTRDRPDRVNGVASSRAGSFSPGALSRSNVTVPRDAAAASSADRSGWSCRVGVASSSSPGRRHDLREALAPLHEAGAREVVREAPGAADRTDQVLGALPELEVEVVRGAALETLVPEAGHSREQHRRGDGEPERESKADRWPPHVASSTRR